MIKYATLRIIWWRIIGFLISDFVIMDGFDLGTASLLPFLGRTDTERQIILNIMRPVWEGNQVWFILGGGVLLAPPPFLGAVAFSSFYFAILLNFTDAYFAAQ